MQENIDNGLRSSEKSQGRRTWAQRVWTVNLVRTSPLFDSFGHEEMADSTSLYAHLGTCNILDQGEDEEGQM
jgi:hypothetical protein